VASAPVASIVTLRTWLVLHPAATPNNPVLPSSPGGAHGADTIANKLAEGFGFDTKVIAADWDVKPDTPPWAIRTTRNGRRYDVRAGNVRNGPMLDEGPELVTGFVHDPEDAPGTDDCLRQARSRKIAAELWTPEGVVRTAGAHPALF
jgi:hypothetical protein